VAIDPPSGPFGPPTVALATAYGLISSGERADYEGRSREGKDEFVRWLVDEKLLALLGYDPTGLDGSGIEATLLQGGYVAVHTYGWTEFEIGRVTQVLTVTTYGIDYYTAEELATDPGDIITRTPAVVSQFVVTPRPNRLYLPLVTRY
jgi:3-phytase/alkaline phosphatase D